VHGIDHVTSVRTRDTAGYYGRFLRDILLMTDCTEKAYDLIFMDVSMPKMDGYDATREVRRRGGTCPIVAFTASVSDEDVASCLRAGMNGHLGKPVTIAALKQALQRWLPRSDAT
jgi:CheY-like chemotaxis protein